jgi:hypothetical protein
VLEQRATAEEIDRSWGIMDVLDANLSLDAFYEAQRAASEKKP